MHISSKSLQNLVCLANNPTYDSNLTQERKSQKESQQQNPVGLSSIKVMARCPFLMPLKKDTHGSKLNLGSLFAHKSKTSIALIDHIHVLGIGLELACNGGSCGGIALKRD